MGTIQLKYSIGDYTHRTRRAFLTVDGAPEDYPIATAGRGTYAIEMNIHYGIRDSNVLIGRYASLAKGVRFVLSDEHDLGCVSTHPFRNIQELMRNHETGSRERAAAYEHRRRCQTVIGNDVWIGMDAMILGGVRIGNGAVVGAGAVVTKNVPPYEIWGGCPARLIRKRFADDVIEKLLSIRWWHWEHEEIMANLDLMDQPEAFAERFYRESATSVSPHTDIQRMREEHRNIFYLLPDIDAKNPVWEKVCHEFLRAKEGSAALFCGIMDSASEEEIERIRSAFSEAKNPVQLHWVGSRGIPTSILSHVDAYITTRESTSMELLDYAPKDVKWISGLDTGMFF